MITLFSSFTTIFFFLVALIAVGIIFEKQFIALEDKLDAWFASKRKTNKKSAQTVAVNKNSVKVKAYRPASEKENKNHGFAA